MSAACLLEAQRVALRHADLLLDQVDAGDHLRHGVLHLRGAATYMYSLKRLGAKGYTPRNESHQQRQPPHPEEMKASSCLPRAHRP